MAGSLAPVMYWAVRTTLCSALWTEAEQLPYQAVMQPARMVSMLQLQNLLRISGPMPNLFSFLGGNRFCSALFTTVLVCLDRSSLLVMWTPRNLKLSTCSTTAPSMRMGGVVSLLSLTEDLQFLSKILCNQYYAIRLINHITVITRKSGHQGKIFRLKSYHFLK